MIAARFRFALFSLISCIALLGLTACHKDKQALPGGATPLAAVQQALDLLKAGDLDDFWKHALPPVDYATRRDDWTRIHDAMATITPQQRTQLNQLLQRLTAPNANAQLAAQIEPRLKQLQKQYGTQLPVMLGIFQTIAGTAVDQNNELSADQKQMLHDIVSTTGGWAQKASWFDTALAKQAIAVITDTARQLDLKNADQLQKLDYDQAMQKYSRLYQGLKKLLALYGLSLDKTIDSVRLRTLDHDQVNAQVKLDYTLLGKALSGRVTLVQENGRWYLRDLLRQARNEHVHLLQAGAGSSSATKAPLSPPSSHSTAKPD
jgi:hypothetical protein